LATFGVKKNLVGMSLYYIFTDYVYQSIRKKHLIGKICL